MSVNWNLNAPIDRNKQQVVVMRSVLVHIGDKQIWHLWGVMARRFYMLVDIEADIEPFPIHYLNVISKAKSFQNIERKNIS